MLAAIVLVLGITTAIVTLQRGLQAVDSSRALTFASQVMQSEFERMRLKSWAQIQAMQDANDTTVALSGAGVPPSGSFACTRTIRDLKADMKEIVINSTWRGYDGREHRAQMVTRYSKSGLYDYFYTAH